MRNGLLFFLLCVFTANLEPASSICSVSKYNQGLQTRVKCSSSTLDEAMNKGGSFVTELTISQSSLGNIPANSFSKYSRTLKSLNLQNCGLRQIHPNAFADLIKLEKLSLSNNNITEVQPNWFMNLHSLEQLDLSFNTIRGINSAVFAGLTRLQRFNLDDNQITCLEPRDMEPMRSLAKFRVTENPLNLKCRAKMTLWFNDKGINYSNGLRSESGSWLDRVLWLCAEDDYVPTNTETQMRECALLNLFNQLKLALKTTESYPNSAQQCGRERQLFTYCILNSESNTRRITNGEAFTKIIIALGAAQERLKSRVN